MKYSRQSLKCVWPVYLLSGALGALLMPAQAHAFTKLISGFETLNSTYLVPLARIMAVTSLLVFVALSFFRKDEYQKQISNVVALSIVAATGTTLIQEVMNAFI